MIKLATFKLSGFKFQGFKFLGFTFPGFGQKNNEGPPDLDQVMRDISQKINNLFGKGKGGGFNGNSQTPSGKDFTVEWMLDVTSTTFLPCATSLARSAGVRVRASARRRWISR